MSYTNQFINVTNEDDDDLSEFIEDVIFHIYHFTSPTYQAVSSLILFYLVHLPRRYLY